MIEATIIRNVRQNVRQLLLEIKIEKNSESEALQIRDPSKASLPVLPSESKQSFLCQKEMKNFLLVQIFRAKQALLSQDQLAEKEKKKSNLSCSPKVERKF